MDLTYRGITIIILLCFAATFCSFILLSPTHLFFLAHSISFHLEKERVRKGSGSIANCTNLQQTNPPLLKFAHYFIAENNRSTRWRDDSYDDKYYDDETDETKSLHIQFFFNAKTHITSFFPILWIWTCCFCTCKHTEQSLTVWGTCIDASTNWFFYMRVHFLHRVFKFKPNPTREAHHPDKCLLLETSHNTHGHIRSARITVFYHVLEWGYRAHTSHTVISELTPNSQWSRLPGWVFNWQVGMRELYVWVCLASNL